MVVLIDPPQWPAHGTLWSHLVSDHSLDELHAFAARLGVPRRGFDLDHYDVPASLHASAVSLGAAPVSAKTVVHRLRDAGLRVRQVDRPRVTLQARRAYVAGEWQRLGAELRLNTADGGWQSAGEALLARWNEPHRHYHDERHLEDVLLSLQQLALRGAQVTVTAYAAAWFHDAVHTGVAGGDEHASAVLAHRTLADFGVDVALRDHIAASILATIPPGVRARGAAHSSVLLQSAAVFVDADLSIFAASDQRYRGYTAAVRREYAQVPDHTFAAARSKILRGYLAKPRLFHTSQAHELWDLRARTNVAAEVVALRAAHPPQQPEH